MTDKAQALRSVRSAAMKELGFGPEVMKQTKVCPVCGVTAGANETKCIQCGAALPNETLFILYKSRHRYCDICDTVVASTSVYCPECGTQLLQKT